jgi:hypothetical protein
MLQALFLVAVLTAGAAPVDAQQWLSIDRAIVRVGDRVRFEFHDVDGLRGNAVVVAVDGGGSEVALGTTDAEGVVFAVFESSGPWEVRAVDRAGGAPVVMPLEVLPVPRQRARLSFWLPVGLVLLVLTWRAAVRAFRSDAGRDHHERAGS